MKLGKPKTKRTYIQARDAETNRSKMLTIYDATPEEVIEHLKRSLKEPRRTSSVAQVAG